jgi:undecaprenyl-diphosphatase
VDWSVFHALNGPFQHQDGAQDAAQLFNAWAIFAVVGLAGAIWFAARPGGSERSKFAALSAAVSVVLALGVNAVLGQLWFHDRPFMDHPKATVLLVRHAADNSFPSDHATVAFAAAFAVLAFHRRFGAFLVLLAAAVAVDRVLVGVHYPIDVIASLFVGLGSALVVTRPGRPLIARCVRQLSRFSDPVVAGARGLLAPNKRP